MSWVFLVSWFQETSSEGGTSVNDGINSIVDNLLVDDLRIKTALVCGALALAIAVSSLLRTKVRNVHLLFAATAADIGFWYLSQSLLGIEPVQVTVLERMRVVLAVLLPLAACATPAFQRPS